jgi:hypothetical protein
MRIFPKGTRFCEGDKFFGVSETVESLRSRIRQAHPRESRARIPTGEDARRARVALPQDSSVTLLRLNWLISRLRTRAISGRGHKGTLWCGSFGESRPRVCAKSGLPPCARATFSRPCSVASAQNSPTYFCALAPNWARWVISFTRICVARTGSAERLRVDGSTPRQARCRQAHRRGSRV